MLAAWCGLYYSHVERASCTHTLEVGRSMEPVDDVEEREGKNGYKVDTDHSVVSHLTHSGMWPHKILW